jgi:hypothetical protein
MSDGKIIFQVVYASQTEKLPVLTVLQETLRAGQSAADAMGKDVSFVV